MWCHSRRSRRPKLGRLSHGHLLRLLRGLRRRWHGGWRRGEELRWSGGRSVVPGSHCGSRSNGGLRERQRHNRGGLPRDVRRRERRRRVLPSRQGGRCRGGHSCWRHVHLLRIDASRRRGWWSGVACGVLWRGGSGLKRRRAEFRWLWGVDVLLISCLDRLMGLSGRCRDRLLVVRLLLLVLLSDFSEHVRVV